MGTGSRGARGHGWLNKYRSGLGGRHLQGRYHARDTKALAELNNQVFALNAKSGESNSSNSSNGAYLDLMVDGESEPRRITIELASAALPETCENFLSLCESGYELSKMFKIEKNVGLCFGDKRGSNGEEGRCSDGLSKGDEAHKSQVFEHEPLVLSHAEKGMVSMLSPGLDKNDSRFIITTVEDAPQLDGSFVAFGRVKEGMKELEHIASSIFTKKGRPTVDVKVVSCGVL